MGKQRIFGVMVLAALTAAVLGANRFWTPEQETVPPAEENMGTASPAVTVLGVSVEEVSEDGTPARDLLPGLDISAVSAAMSEEERAAFETYLPILRGEETFCWVAGPYDGYPDYDWEPFDADMATVRDKFWDGYGKRCRRH